MTIRSLVISVILAALLAPLAVAGALAQDQPRRTLFEVLFGPPEQPQQAAPQPSAPQPQTTSPRLAPAPQASVPPPAATVDKAENATRIAVFGDSMAVDLAAGLNRLYADDPETRIIGRGVGSSGFVRNDFFDWQDALDEAIAQDSFDIAVVIIGINDRQALGSAAPLTEEWRTAYSARIARFLDSLRQNGKPVVWVELPPMEQTRFSSDIAQISALHKSAVQAAGGEWVETYERYMSEAGNYTAVGPDLNGDIVSMRKGDGVHFSNAGSDKLAFYIDRAIQPHHAGGGITTEVADLLDGTNAAERLRPPFQGLGQTRLFETAGLVQQMGGETRRADDLLFAGAQSAALTGFDLEMLLSAPFGRVDSFGMVSGDAVANPSGR